MKRVILIAWIAVVIGFVAGYLVGVETGSNALPPEVAGGSHTGNAIETIAEPSPPLSDKSGESPLSAPDDSLPAQGYLAVPHPTDSTSQEPSEGSLSQ